LEESRTSGWNSSREMSRRSWCQDSKTTVSSGDLKVAPGQHFGNQCYNLQVVRMPAARSRIVGTPINYFHVCKGEAAPMGYRRFRFVFIRYINKDVSEAR
jgi:hypothetical protein